MEKSPLSRIAAALASAALLCGCATGNKPLYGWAGYQPQVYEYLKSDSQDYQEHINILEKSLAQMQDGKVCPPPGFHAQLGLLYAKTDQKDKAIEAFDAEKTLFPESAAFMDYLSSTMMQPAQQKEHTDENP